MICNKVMVTMVDMPIISIITLIIYIGSGLMKMIPLPLLLVSP